MDIRFSGVKNVHVPLTAYSELFIGLSVKGCLMDRRPVRGVPHLSDDGWDIDFIPPTPPPPNRMRRIWKIDEWKWERVKGFYVNLTCASQKKTLP